MLLGYLMYRSGLVPRRMALLGLIGGPLVGRDDDSWIMCATCERAALAGARPNTPRG